MNFCSSCGATVTLKHIPSDDIPRHVCDGCGMVHYSNPRVLVSCLCTWEDKALWMRRAEDPRKGYWAVPAGYMEEGESLQEAAARELFEETCVKLDPHSLVLYAVGSVTHINQVYVSFRAELPSPEFSCGPESLEVALFSYDELPRGQLAFPQTMPAIENFYREMPDRNFGVWLGEYSGNEDLLLRMV